jgi:hypothetical protein
MTGNSLGRAAILAELGALGILVLAVMTLHK